MSVTRKIQELGFKIAKSLEDIIKGHMDYYLNLRIDSAKRLVT